DFDEERTPVETNAFWAVKLDHDFIGKKKTIEKMNEKHDVFVGIEMINGIPRKGFEIYNSSLIGHITSGTYSPILKKGIGLGYVASGYENVGTNVKVLIRGKKEYGRIVKLPFV
ncbi:MAG: glycine cleavage T C-terminal barrel domain-containing protein, partial [Candidatus Thermoplasmatota archaeon]